jgi:hypothetical protein
MARGQNAKPAHFDHVTPLEWSYLAGRIDADGSIGCYKHNPKWTMVRLDLYSNDKPFLEWVQGLLGGYISINNTTWQWNAGTPNLVAILTCLLPYLRTKKDQAQHAITCRLHLNNHIYYCMESKRLNGRLAGARTEC